MERVRRYLHIPRLRIPTWSQLKDGSFFRGKDEETDSGFCYLKEFEARLAQVQEVALWSSPVTSLLWVIISQILVYHFNSSPVLPIVAKLVLATFLYCTWVYRVWPAIRVPPEHPEDTEGWTPLHPDVLSAPELSSWIQGIRHKFSQIISGLYLLHSEQPGKFCLLSSTVCLLVAILGTQVTTGFLLHSSVLLSLLLPGILVRAYKVPSLAPGLTLLGDLISGMGDLMIYRGLNAPHLENKDLDEFVPEVTQETESFLEKALSYVQRKDNDEDLSLISGLAIPSHEEVELEPRDLELEADLIPTTGALALEHGSDLLESDDDDCNLAPTQLALARMEDCSEDEDSLDLEPTVGVMTHLVTSSVTAVTTSVSSVRGTVSSVTSALLGGFLAKTDSEPDLEDFELVDENEFELETPNI